MIGYIFLGTYSTAPTMQYQGSLKGVGEVSTNLSYSWVITRRRCYKLHHNLLITIL
jgi:hypothetical protein